MLKYEMLLHHQDKVAFIEQLMQLGLVQIQSKQAEEDSTTQELSVAIRETEDALRRFSKRKFKTLEMHLSDSRPTLNEIASIEQELEHTANEVEALEMEIKLLKPWGDFDRDSLNLLEISTKREIKFFEYPERHFDTEWQKKYHLQMINQVGGNLYFIIFKEPEQELPISPVALPEARLSDLIERHKTAKEKVQLINRTLDYYASSLSNVLQLRLAEAKDQLSNHLAHTSASAHEGSTLWQISAWCPSTAQEEVQKFLSNTNTVYVQSVPDIDETPPVLLRNSSFAKLFEPIGTLFSLPNYYELDLTVLFAPFFLLFFGLCQGDAGYGILILIIASILKLSTSADKRGYLTLGQLFGLATIAAGILSGTFFGLEMIRWNLPEKITSMFLNQDQLFNLALIIGFVQILFGMSVQAYKQWKFQGFIHAVSRISWILLLLSLMDIYVIQFVPGISSIVLWIALTGIVFFGAPEKGWLKSLGFGLADLYNITGILGDLLSYIRLFALGVASSILGLVINSIAVSIKDTSYIGFILFIIVLVVGHGINFLLSTLSAFVHPMRLTFVEFYKNTGFIGGGRPFKPFSKQSIQSNQT